MAKRGNSYRRRRRGGMGLLYLYRLFSAVVMIGCVAAALTMFFRVRQVTITGIQRYTEEEVLEAAEVELGDNLFLLNKPRTAAKIAAALPYVETLRIHRNLPDTLVIEVEECTHPLALIQDGKAWLISAGGKIVDCLAPEDAASYGQITGCHLLLPEVGRAVCLTETSMTGWITGPGGTVIAASTESGENGGGGDSTEDNAERDVSSILSDPRLSLLDLLSALGEARMMPQVRGIRLDDPNVLLMDYTDRFTVKLPYGADYRKKLRALNAYLDSDEIQDNMTGTFDMTKDDKNYFKQNAG